MLSRIDERTEREKQKDGSTKQLGEMKWKVGEAEGGGRWKGQGVGG